MCTTISMTLGCLTVPGIALFLVKPRYCFRILLNIILQAPSISQPQVAISGKQSYDFAMHCHTKILPWRYVRGKCYFHILPLTRKAADFYYSWPNLLCAFLGHFWQYFLTIFFLNISYSPSLSMVSHQSSPDHDANYLSGCNGFNQSLNKSTRFPLAKLAVPQKFDDHQQESGKEISQSSEEALISLLFKLKKLSLNQGATKGQYPGPSSQAWSADFHIGRGVAGSCRHLFSSARAWSMP